LEALQVIPEEKARRGRCVVFEKRGNLFKVAMVDPENAVAKEIVAELKKFGTVLLFTASDRALEKFLAAYSEIPQRREEITAGFQIKEALAAEFSRTPDPIAHLKEIAVQKPETSDFLAAILAAAVISDSSDIHFEAQEKTALIRFRQDGILWPILEVEGATYQKIRDRIKLLSGMKINIREKPQDGRFTIKGRLGTVEVRGSSVPGPNGENFVLRLLNPKTIQLRLEDLGLRPDDFEIIAEELKRPNGLIIVTGPTGSGKTTTLYAFLKRINRPGIKVITIEDPIEYRLEGIEQTQINPDQGYNFATGLASILRQDPDVILVGEIRDLATAETTMHASLTGHLVFSTLHTNDAVGTIPRLIDLGVKPSIIAPATNLAIAQRLLRRLCPRCRETRPLSELEVKKLESYLKELPPRVKPRPKLKANLKVKTANPNGCEHCAGRGYKGRIGVFELFQVGTEMEGLIQKSPTEEAIRELAKKTGMVTMMQDALLKVLAGITDFAEVERVVGPV